MSYVAIIIAVLVLMNTYPLTASEDLVFRSKEATLKSSVSVMTTALTGLGELNEENVAAAMTVAEETGISRILVTDPAGLILYDSRETDSAQGRYAFYTELVQALRGFDAFHVAFAEGAFQSRCASPVIYHSRTIGAVYAYEYDTEQAELLQSFQKNLVAISVLVGVLVLMLSLLLSRLFTRQISDLLQAIRSVREGAYSRRANVHGSDEIAQIAAEFNSLTDRLQTTENARRRFVSDASHELKTPLAGIRLLSDSIVQNEDMPPELLREFAQDIGQEAERLSRTTEKLLQLTRLDVPKKEKPVPVDLAEVARNALKMLEVLAAEKHVALEWELDGGCLIWADPDDIHQVIFNLVENAVKYNVEDGRVTVLLYEREGEVRLHIDDTGIGIPEEDMPHIFDRFYRVDEARSSSRGGSGLGLAIVKETVEKYGGRVTASRRERGGTRFTVAFPLWREVDGHE